MYSARLSARQAGNSEIDMNIGGLNNKARNQYLDSNNKANWYDSLIKIEFYSESS